MMVKVKQCTLCQISTDTVHLIQLVFQKILLLGLFEIQICSINTYIIHDVALIDI